MAKNNKINLILRYFKKLSNFETEYELYKNYRDTSKRKDKLKIHKANGFE